MRIIAGTPRYVFLDDFLAGGEGYSDQVEPSLVEHDHMHVLGEVQVEVQRHLQPSADDLPELRRAAGTGNPGGY